MDTLGMSILSIVQRLSLLQRYKCMDIYRQGAKKFVHCREVVHSSECPLSEVPLYILLLGLTKPQVLQRPQ